MIETRSSKHKRFFSNARWFDMNHEKYHNDVKSLAETPFFDARYFYAPCKRMIMFKNLQNTFQFSISFVFHIVAIGNGVFATNIVLLDLKSKYCSWLVYPFVSMKLIGSNIFEAAHMRPREGFLMLKITKFVSKNLDFC